MKAEVLLKHFDRICEAAGAIPRMRRFILDLAVRGKLVDQDPSDEPAAELLKRIAAVKESTTRKVKKNKSSDTADKPFELPKSWQWSQLASIGYISPRNDATIDVIASFVPMPLISSEYGVPVQHECRPWGEIKSGYTHFAEGDVGLAKITPCFENGKSTVFRGLTGGIGAGTTELHVVRPIFINPDFVLIFLKSPHFINSGIPKMTGTAGQKRIPTDYFAFAPFPVPPLEEQQRIVSKVDELMALCARLEASRDKRETRRTRLVNSSLNRINIVPPADVKDAIRFYLDRLPQLTTRLEHIKSFRETVLSLAMRGLLVPQNAIDEPASELLRKIQQEKALLLKDCKIKKSVAVVDLTGSGAIEREPCGWATTTLQSLCSSVTDGDHLPPPKTESGVPFLVIGNVRNQVVDFNGSRFVSLGYYESLDEIRRPQRGDLLYTLVGSYGIPVIVRDDRPFCVQRHIGILRPSKFVDVGFLACVMESKMIFDQATACATGIAQKTVSLSGLRKFVVPLPPLAEQKLIVAKINELLSACSRVEKLLTVSEQLSLSLMEAVLNRVFDASTPANA